MERYCSVETGFLLGVMKIFWNYIIVMASQHCDYTKSPELLVYTINWLSWWILCSVNVYLNKNY